MKITKKQLKQIIYHEIKRSLNETNGDQFRQNLLKYFPEKEVSGALGEDPAPVPDEGADQVAFEKLRQSMSLMEKAMLYMYSNGEEGQSPVKIVGLVQDLLSEEEEERPLEAPLAEEEKAKRSDKGNITQVTREKYATVGKDGFPIFDKKSAIAAINLRGHASPADQKKIINKAAKYAPVEAKKAREAEKKEKK